MAKGSFVISAQNKIKEGLDAAQRDLNKFENETKKTGEGIGELDKKTSLLDKAFAHFTITAGDVVNAVRAIARAAYSTVEAYAVQEKAIFQLNAAIKLSDTVSESSKKSLTDFASAIQNMTGVGDEAVISLEAMLIASGRNEEQVRKLIAASADYSAATGKDMKSAVEELNKTFSGTEGRLGMLIPALKDLTDEQLKSGAAIDIVAKQYGGFAAELTNTADVSITKLKAAWGDLLEEIGRAITPAITPIINNLTDFIQNKAIPGIRRFFEVAAAVFKNLPEVARLSFNLVLEIIEKAFSWESLKNILVSLTKFVANTFASAIINLPALFRDVVRLMFNPVAELGKYIADTLGKAIKLDFKNIQSPGEFFKNVINSEVEIAGQLVKDFVSFATAQAGNVKTLVTDLKGSLAGIDFSGFRDAVNALIPNVPDTVPTSGGTATTTPSVAISSDTSKIFYDRMAALWDVDSADQLSSQVDFSGKTQRDNIAALWDSESADTISQFVKFDESAQRYYSNLLSTFDERVAAWDSEGADTVAVDWDGSILNKALKKQSDEYWANQAKIIDQDAADSIEVDWDGSILTQALQEKSNAFWASQAEIIDKDSADSIRVNYLTAEKERFENAVRAWDAEGADALSVLVDFDDAAQRYWAARGEEFNRAVKLFDETSSDTVVVNYLTAEKERFENAVRAWDSEGADALSEFVDFGDAVQRYWAIVEENFNRAAYIIDRESADALSSQVDFTGTTQQQNVWATADAESADSLSAQVNFPELTIGADAVVDAFIGLDDTIATISSGMGDFGASMLGPILELMSALGPFGNMIAGMNPLLALLIPVIEGFTAVMAPALTAVMQPLIDALTMLGTMLGQALLPILDALAPIVSLIANILMTVLAPVIRMLAPIIQAIVIILQPFSGIIATLAKVFTILMAPVQWLADLFSWVGEVLQTFAWNIMHPFRQESGPGSFYSDAFSGLSDRLAAIDALATNNQTISSAVSPSTASTASQSASYRTQQITINIYQQAPVVGSGGMDEFVGMIRTRFNELAYYGA